MTSEISLQIIGVIRFSVLTDDFTPLNYGDAQTMRQRFFDPHRLEERLTMFEHLCLSTLARQTDKGFRCAILTAEDMPDWAMNRLKAMLAPHPQFLLYAAPMGHHYALIKDAYRATAAPGFTHRVSFRLDDDDGMALCLHDRMQHDDDNNDDDDDHDAPGRPGWVGGPKRSQEVPGYPVRPRRPRVSPSPPTKGVGGGSPLFHLRFSLSPLVRLIDHSS